MDKDFLGYPLEIQKIAFKRQISVQVHLNSTIKVTAGKLVTQKQILSFLENHKSWIEEIQHNNQKLRRQYPIKKFIEGEEFPYLGNGLP
ncbi:MAG: DUF45 domain-containing protein, partial [Bdellovibrionales bacterium]|nr:DUF45 domain-containing protein [Bdellovibrionales bacterium]